MTAPALSLPKQVLSNPSLSLPDRFVPSWWRRLEGRTRAASPAADGAGRLLERQLFERVSQRLLRQAEQAERRAQTLRLGSAKRPYLPCLWEGISASSVLRALEGLNIQLHSASPQLLEELELWRELNRYHVVQVEIPITLGRNTALNGQWGERLDLAQRVSELGLGVRLALSFDGTPCASQLRELFDQVRHRRLGDVQLADGVKLSSQDALLLRQLRLQAGLPWS